MARRLIWLTLAIGVLAIGLGLWRSSTGDRGAPSVAGNDVQAPWMDSDGIHLKGMTFRTSDISSSSDDLFVESVAVTRNGLVASLPELADENPDSADEEHWSALFELLPSDGVRKLTTRRLGKAIGDIRGTTVFWVEPDPHGIKLVAYDTEHHRYLRTLSVDDDTFRLYAVDKAKAYLMGDDSVRLWDAMAADNRLAEVPNLPRDAFIADAHDGTLFVSAGDNGSRLISASSRVLKTFDSTMIATFSPDGKSIAAIEYLPGFSDESTVFTWNLERSVEVPLDLRAGIMVDDFQWEADGDLLVLSQPAEDSDDASQEVHSCSVETGACTPFSGRWQHTTSGYDQFAYDAY